MDFHCVTRFCQQESQLEQFATKVDGVVKKIVAGEPDLKKRAALEKASREKSRKAKLGWAKAAAAAKKVRENVETKCKP